MRMNSDQKLQSENIDITMRNLQRVADLNVQKRFIDRFAHFNLITRPEDWYSVKLSDIRKKGGSEILKSYGHSLFNLLSKHYPGLLFLSGCEQTEPEHRKIKSGKC